ncbi:MAG: hypothetical protein AAF184_11265 [Pseudomonadota bacterium]
MNRRELLAASLALAGVAACGTRRVAQESFECPPCGCAADGIEFSAPGQCPECDMTLRPIHEQRLGMAPTALPQGAGHFRLPGGAGQESAAITVHYYLPPGFTADAPVLLVVPGSGRDAAEYRNVWLAMARSSGKLVAALEYPAETYGFAEYHMGGLIKDLSFPDVQPRREGRGEVLDIADDGDIAFAGNPDPARWLFADFDRIFEHLKQATGASATHYDVFGHSAGAQIAHRFVLCRPQSQARRVIAANAGFYTLPSFDQALPVGLDGTGLTPATLFDSFSKELIVLLGAEDNHDGAGGTLLHSPLVDQQGRHRLSRGQFFFRMAQALAEREQVPLRWRLTVVDGVGHDFRAMSDAAAPYLEPDA